MNASGSFCHILFQRGEAEPGPRICLFPIDCRMSCHKSKNFNCTYFNFFFFFCNALDYRSACWLHSRHWSFIVETVRQGLYLAKGTFRVHFCLCLGIHVTKVRPSEHLLLDTFHRSSLLWSCRTQEKLAEFVFLFPVSAFINHKSKLQPCAL